MTRPGAPRILAMLGLLSAAVYSLGFALDPSVHATRLFPRLYYPLFALYLGAIAWVWRRPGLPVAAIVGFALVFRLLAMADPPSLSSDVYRYPWDGRVGRAGISPYRYPPEHPALAGLRDSRVQPRINRPWARTVYPPGAQILFLALPYDVDATRLVLTAFDMAAILLLVRLLRRKGLDPARVVVYAWAPLVVYEIGNGGHLEAAVIPLLVAAVLAVRRERPTRAGLLLGAAAALKLYPALAGVALARHRPWTVAVAALAVVGGLYGAYALSAGGAVLGFLPDYVRPAEDHNIGLRALLELGLSPLTDHPRAAAFGLCGALLLAGLWRIRRSEGEVTRKMLAVAGLYLLTLPTAFHPWYALWLLPWLCFHLRASWLWLTAALPLSYLKYGATGGVMPPWVVPVELVPTAALLLLEARRRRA